jgi:LytS/YehU family sensor histidine kinase
MILQNSENKLITLEQELESLELYLSLETLRFDNHFTYKIEILNGLDIAFLKVPPLILQPFVENSIWHGLMHKEEKGHLNIELYQSNEFLCFKIADNGVGRKQASVLSGNPDVKHKPMGIRITSQRIAMAQNENSKETAVTINDLVDANGISSGTEVIIKLPMIYD